MFFILCISVYSIECVQFSTSVKLPLFCFVICVVSFFPAFDLHQPRQLSILSNFISRLFLFDDAKVQLCAHTTKG